MSRYITTTCKQGTLRGTITDDICIFNGVPYARDGGRFKAALPMQNWNGERDAIAPAPVFPQRSRAMICDGPDGPIELEQREDAFCLNIWTPATQGSRPVVLWVHGGAYSSGGCSMPCYSGEEFARNQNMVFVGVNYRLGALGNLHLPGVADENLALRDLGMALQWVYENIANFGGNPTQICLVGQSAGAWYVAALAASGLADNMVARYALMSIPGSQPLALEDATELSDALLKHLKITDNPAAIIDKPVNKILDATRKAARDSKHFGISFMPCVDGQLLQGDMFEVAFAKAGSIPLLNGKTAQESTFFVSQMREAIDNMGMPELLGLLGGFCEGQDPAMLWQYYEKTSEPESQYMRLVRITSDSLFGNIAQRIASGFETSFGYLIEYQSGTSQLMACHCMDLPLFFGNLNAWANNPMMQGVNLQHMAQVSKKFQDAFAQFVRTGNPGWQQYSSEDSREVFN